VRSFGSKLSGNKEKLVQRYEEEVNKKVTAKWPGNIEKQDQMRKEIEERDIVQVKKFKQV
jgi:hypothetical protein